MAQVSYGTITINDITDISDVYLIYALALNTASAIDIINDEYDFDNSGERGWDDTHAQEYPTWQSGYQIWIRQVTIKEGINEPEYGTPYLDTAVNQINKDLVAYLDTQGLNIEALNSKIRFIWTNLTSHSQGEASWVNPNYPAGTYAASGKYDNSLNEYTIDYENSNTYGYNSFLSHNSLNLRYDAINMTQLSTAALTFYRPTTINNQLVQGDRGLVVNANGIDILSVSNYKLSSDTVVDPTKIYYTLNNNIYDRVTTPYGNPQSNSYYEHDIDAQLNANGLVLKKGGIKAGAYSSTIDEEQNFVYLSSEDYGIGTKIGDSDSNKTDWRQIIGNKFGVDKAGNLYAAGAHIDGDIIAQSLTIGSGANAYSGIAAINITGYSIEIEVADIAGSTETKKLIPHLLHNGENADSEVTDKTDFIWYVDNSTNGISGDSVDGSITGAYGSSYRVIYDFDDGAVEGGTATRTLTVDPSKYITRISDTGITIHPEMLTEQSSWIQLDGNGMELFNSSNESIARYGSTVRIGKTNEAHIVQTSTGLNFVDSSGITQASMTANNGTFVLEDVISAHKIELGSGLTIENNQGEILASFDADGAQIGKDDESHLKMSLNSMELADRVGTSYLEIADNDIVEEVTQTKDNFDTNYFSVNYPICQVLRLAIDGVETSDYSYRKGSTTIDVFDTRPSSPVSLSVTYTTVALGKYYNFGYRGNGYPEGKLSVIEGLNTVAQGDYSHAEGRDSYAQGEGAHAEGYNTDATGQNSHAEGAHTNATNHYSHAEGLFTYATGYGSHAQNSHTIASKADQTALGRYNIEDTATTTADQKALIIGNGTSDNARSNALTVDWNGNVEAAGAINGLVKHYGAITGATIADKQLTHGTSWQNIGSITLPEGAWLLYLTASFALNGTGYRLLAIADSSAAAGSIIRTNRQAPANGATTSVSINCPLAGGQTYYINGCQNSGTTLKVETRYTAIKIGESFSSY